MKTLQKLRANERKTQQEIANFLQISSQAYSHYENGIREPDFNTLKKIADYFNVSTDYLLEREKPEAPHLSQKEQELLKAFNDVSPRDKNMVMGYLYGALTGKIIEPPRDEYDKPSLPPQDIKALRLFQKLDVMQKDLIIAYIEGMLEGKSEKEK